jgi:cysteinyl-tRNA synthetase
MSAIKFFNTLSGKLDDFKPLKGNEVGMYTCGPTVYDYAHIGNFRAFVFEDLLRRFLEFKGFKVKHVMNLTDVDDKTIAGAQREKKKLNDYTAKYTQAFNEDLKALNCLPPTSQPRATEKIKLMQDLIAKLIEKGIAYENKGSVYYRVSKFQGYGKLSKKRLEMNVKGASERMDSDEYESKEEATDFVLWKSAKEGEVELGAAWDSPWGKGRPGWHIECSAMSMEALGETFDIHAGGEDLVFPHHENEIAQSEGATGKPFVKYWLHCRFLLVNGEKMSKSKGNFYTLRDLLAKGYDPMAIRYTLLATHYRQQVNFTEEGVKASKEALKRIRDFWYRVSFGAMEQGSKVTGGRLSTLVKATRENFNKALANDLNVSEALGQIFAFIKLGNGIPGDEITQKEFKEADAFLNEIDNVLGVFSRAFFVNEIPNDIKDLVAARNKARQEKKYDQSDEMRDEARKNGYILEDAKDGTRVKKLL